MSIRPLLCLILITCCGVSRAAEDDIDLGGNWELERVELQRQGRPDQVLRGLICGETETHLDFAEIVRPRGKPMYVVIQPVEKKLIVKEERLEGEAKRILEQRLDRFRFQARFEAGAMEDVNLHQAGGRFHYEGPWFSLASSSDELSTRLIVVRLEQIFRAYRQILPPRREPTGKLQVRMHGSEQEYRAFLADQKLELKAPAFFSAKMNLVSVACELSECVQRYELAQSQLAAAEKDLNKVDSHFRDKLQQTIQQMKDAGFSRQDREAESAARQAAWDREKAQKLLELAESRRGNTARFQEATQAILQRLFHEGLHAYLANYIADEDEPLPAWVHEGLAQVFETGQFDGETLRIDAPDPHLMRDLHVLLRTKDPLELLQPLLVRKQPWLSHDRDKSLSRGQEYIAAWGLCWYLLFDEHWLTVQRLHSIGDPSADTKHWQGLPIASEEELPSLAKTWGKRMQEMSEEN